MRGLVRAFTCGVSLLVLIPWGLSGCRRNEQKAATPAGTIYYTGPMAPKPGSVGARQQQEAPGQTSQPAAAGDR